MINLCVVFNFIFLFYFFPFFLCEMREFSSNEKGIKNDIKKSQETQRSCDSNQVLVVFTG